MDGLDFKRAMRRAFALSLAVLAGFLLCVWAVAGRAARQDAASGAPQAGTAPQPPVRQRFDDRYLLVLDAGHGGEDPGAVSGDGMVYEADVNRVVAARLAALLAAHEDELLLLKSYAEDANTPPLARANVAAQNGADLLVSLHLNAGYSVYERGFSCYPQPPGRAHHDESVRFSRLLIDRVAATGHPILGSSGIWYAYFLRQPGGFHKLLLDAAQADADDPIPDEGFTVVEQAGCPAVLVEQWFISSGEDMARFNHEAGYDEMARCLYLAVCDYFGLSPRA